MPYTFPRREQPSRARAGGQLCWRGFHLFPFVQHPESGHMADIASISKKERPTHFKNYRVKPAVGYDFPVHGAALRAKLNGRATRAVD